MESLLFLHQNAFFAKFIWRNLCIKRGKYDRRSVIDRKDEFLGKPMSLCEKADEFLGKFRRSFILAQRNQGIKDDRPFSILG